MNPLWTLDPPGTINPAKLVTKVEAESNRAFEVLNTSSLPLLPNVQTTVGYSIQSGSPAAPTLHTPRSTIPLPRVTSDCEVIYNISQSESQRYQKIRKEFEALIP